MSELKSCPFCGSNNVQFYDVHGASVECNDCWAAMTGYVSCDKAVAAWNRRADDDELAAVRRALNGYADSNLASLAETLRKRNETLEAQAEEERRLADEEYRCLAQELESMQADRNVLQAQLDDIQRMGGDDELRELQELKNKCDYHAEWNHRHVAEIKRLRLEIKEIEKVRDFLADVRKELCETLEDVINSVAHNKVSIGDFHTHYMPQISIERVEGWRAALAKAKGETDGTV